MKVLISFLAIFLFISASSKAEDDIWSIIEKRSDVKITVTEKPELSTSSNPKSNGKTYRKATFTGGVVIQEVDGGIVGWDISPHGAVLCGWEIYTTIKNTAEACSSEEKNEFKDNINYAVNKFNDFIVANSLTPVSKNELEEKIQKRFLEQKEALSKMSKDEFQQTCSSDFIVGTRKQIKSMSQEKFRKSIDDALSVPRPPVMNPCL